MALSLEDISLENVGTWPLPIKFIAIGLVALLLLFLAYWLDTQDELAELSQLTDKEKQLRTEFENKQQEAASITAYKAQLVSMNKSFGNMLRQLPVSTEVPGLLEDISKTGIATGLDFKLFKPLPERQLDFYAELPIQITVTGTYHQLAEFVSRVAGLDRIVTLHDFSIDLVKGDPSQNKNNSSVSTGDLQMNMTAMTYRYTEGTVVEGKDKKGKKKEGQ